MVQPQQSRYQAFSDDRFIENDSGKYEEPEKELLKIIMQVKELLNEFEHTALRGEFLYNDPVHGKIWKKSDTHLKIMNEIGISEIMARLSGIVNEKTPISYITDEDYYKKMLYFDMSISEMFAKRCEVWELDIEMAKPIKDAMIELADAVLSMSIEGFTAMNFKTQYQKHDINRNTQEQQGGEGRSFLGIPLGKK